MWQWHTREKSDSTANNMVLGQIKTEDKSNEITAIPQLLNLLDIKGWLVTIDAMGCQTDIACKIVEKEADYLLAVKGNQGHLPDDIKEAIEQTPVLQQQSASTLETNHGAYRKKNLPCY